MARLQGGRPIRDVFADERPRLVPLPAHPFELALVRPIAVGKTPYVRFDGNDYSVPHTLAQRTLTLAAEETTLRMLDGASEVARHVRCYDRGQRLEDRAHLAALGEEKRRARDLRGRDRLRANCPSVSAFLDAVAQRNVRLSSQTALLLTLLDRYGARDLDAAVADALTRGAVSAQSVAHILDQLSRQRRQKPPLPQAALADPRAAAIVVKPHALGSYDKLGRKRGDGHE
jgi:hypothetical protein